MDITTCVSLLWKSEFWNALKSRSFWMFCQWLERFWFPNLSDLGISGQKCSRSANCTCRKGIFASVSICSRLCRHPHFSPLLVHTHFQPGSSSKTDSLLFLHNGKVCASSTALTQKFTGAAVSQRLRLEVSKFACNKSTDSWLFATF